MVLGALGCLLVTFFATQWDAQEALLVGFGGLAMAGGLVVVVIYRCPECDAVPNEDGIPFDPKQCQKCGARLK